MKIADDLARQRGDQVGGGDDVGDRRRTRQDDRNPPSQAPRGENRIDQARAAPVRRDPDMAGVDHVIGGGVGFERQRLLEPVLGADEGDEAVAPQHLGA